MQTEKSKERRRTISPIVTASGLRSLDTFSSLASFQGKQIRFSMGLSYRKYHVLTLMVGFTLSKRHLFGRGGAG